MSWFWTNAPCGVITACISPEGIGRMPVSSRTALEPDGRLPTQHVFLRTLLLLGIAAMGLSAAAPALAQPDSTRRAILEAKGLPPDHTPRRALWRALAVPGWGQVYNRQYYKTPFVYVGLAGFTAAIIYSNNEYILYRRAALYKQNEDTMPNPYAQYEDAYRRIEAQVGGEIRANVLRQQRDKYRRYRDLSVVGVGLYYALTVLDAYVSAQLLSFDVGEELSMRVQPSGSGVTARLKWRF